MGLINFSHANEDASQQVAIFAGGCFWCTQHDFDAVAGIVSTTVGYTGGSLENPTYEEVCEKETGHVEAILIFFDPSQVSYEQLLDIYFHGIDPMNSEGQFCDIGSQYRPVIFYTSPSQKQLAERYKKQLIDSKKIESVAVDILPAQPFYAAEEYHQAYYRKNPFHYNFYHSRSGREQRLQQIWKNKK
jgi:peptide-methionine (S)-S-oxide reductase